MIQPWAGVNPLGWEEQPGHPGRADEQASLHPNSDGSHATMCERGIRTELCVCNASVTSNHVGIITSVLFPWSPGGGGGGGGGGGALGQVSYGGVQLWGPNPYPILGKAGLRKHTLF